MDNSRVFHYFYEISKIPRGSGNEKEISDYLVNFAKTHNLFVYQDEYNNVLIRKPATKGYEKYKSICLQGHMDMVCEKNSDKVFDFTKDAIEVIIENGYLTANGTTLGADNGISVAITLAILESNIINHPELEILLTTDEEVGMVGARGFDITKLNSKILVNIDSEEYGSIYVSSAGSTLVENFLEFDTEKIDDNSNLYKLSLKGLNGGHSGADIHLNTANANKVMAELISKINEFYSLNIVDIKGGTKNNTIPRESEAKILVKANEKEINKILQVAMDSISYKYKNSENNMNVSLEKLEIKEENMLNKNDTKKVLEYILNIPNGVIKMSKLTPNLTETSLNLGILNLEKEKNKKVLRVNNSIRSLVIEEQEYITKYIESYTKNFDGKSKISKAYNPWEYKEKSEIRDYFAKIFEEQIGYKPRILAMHAGLETGLFAEKNPNLDIISIGPDIKNPHTPDERMSIKAVEETYEYLLNALEKFDIEKK